jgi:hypothetical protein
MLSEVRLTSVSQPLITPAQVTIVANPTREVNRIDATPTPTSHWLDAWRLGRRGRSSLTTQDLTPPGQV